MKSLAPLVLLMALATVFRLLGGAFPEALPNFQPVAALVLCTAVFLPRRWLWVPFAAWFLTVPLTNALMGFGWSPQVGVAALGLLLTAGVGLLLRGRSGSLGVLAGAAGCALLSYVLMNTASWVLLPDYPRTAEGFWQAQWTGAAHHALPTWVFLRNALAANLLFTALFLLGQRSWFPELGRGAAPEPVRS